MPVASARFFFIGLLINVPFLFSGYGCWLSGIDVSTQMLNQNFQDPFVAIVVDPVRTISAGKVNLGAFRWVFHFSFLF
jgi:hypothetical protein